MVYVSHFLEEVLELADDVTTMRNGRHVSTRPAAGTTVEMLILGMLGRDMEGMFPDIKEPSGTLRPVLEVRNARVPGRVHGVDLDVCAGEVVGIFGLVGSGRSELALSLFGAVADSTADMRVAGEKYAPASPRAALRAGVCLLPESRKDQGLFLGLDQRRNTSMNSLSRFVRYGLISHAREGARVCEALVSVAIDRINISGRVGQLSGGNQQKVLLAKCLLSEPRILILDEPTRGVDVGARRSIYDKVAELVDSGMALIVISSDIEEVTHLSHRLYVMREGKVAAQFNRSEFDHDTVLNAAFGLVAAT